MNRNHEGGFTLVELLVVIVILGVISYVLTESIVQGLRITDGTFKRFAESIDAETFAASFVGDVQSSDDVSEGAAAAGGTGDPCTASDAQPLLRLHWTDGRFSRVTTYTVEADADEVHLVRRYCEQSSDDLVPKLVRKHALASYVKPETETERSVRVTLACSDPSAVCPQKPNTVTMSVTDASDYTFTLTGSRRAV